jgi:hypothetical protein
MLSDIAIHVSQPRRDLAATDQIDVNQFGDKCGNVTAKQLSSLVAEQCFAARIATADYSRAIHGEDGLMAGINCVSERTVAWTTQAGISRSSSSV